MKNFCFLVIAFVLAGCASTTNAPSERNVSSLTCDEMYAKNSQDWHICANSPDYGFTIGRKIQQESTSCSQTDYVEGSACHIFISNLKVCEDSLACQVRAYKLFQSKIKK